METNYKISIPTPCHENWEAMTPTTTGRFCGSCTKNVVDFTAMMPTDIQQYFTANTGQNICGRFKNEQLETLIIQVPSSVLYSQMPFHKAFLLALFIAMGTTLFSCKDNNGNSQKIDKVEIVDSLKTNPKAVLLGDTIAVPPPMEKSIKKGEVEIKKSTKGKVKCVTKYEKMIQGDIQYIPEESQIDTTKVEIMGKPAVEEKK